MPTPTAALPYHEPPIPTLLITSTFLLLLNLINYLFDNLIYCGLLGQLFVGVAWGAPGAQWPSVEFQEAVVALGYLGLVLLVYEGGLSTSLPALLKNLPLSSAVAATGILLPIALSFSLRALIPHITALQAFAAGAALCSTSLGTTFTVLGTSGLVGTRLGTVLAAGAMMDDVVGLVLVKVISGIGGEGEAGLNKVVVVRPVVVSVGCVVVLVAGCWGLGSKWGRKGVRAVMGWVERMGSEVEGGSRNGRRVWRWLMLGGGHMAFIVQTLLLIGFVAAAVHAGTSGLFAAYLAGTFVSWWDCEFGLGAGEEGVGNAGGVMRNDMERVSGPESPDGIRNGSSIDRDGAETTTPTSVRSRSHYANWTGLEVYERYYSAIVERVLKPFFFASIGFAIPMKDLFKGHIIWRGIVYTVLMLLGKLLTGIWLVRLDFSSTTAILFPTPPVKRLLRSCSPAWLWCMRKPKDEKQPPASGAAITRGHDGVDVRANSHAAADATISAEERQPRAPSPAIPASGGVKEGQTQQQYRQEQHTEHRDQHDPSNKTSAMTESPLKKWPRPRSLYPASILGMAMVARGEIGFLISSLGESSGIFTGQPMGAGSGGDDDDGQEAAASDIYLVVTWAIMLCTVIGPVTVGMLVRRVKRLQEQHDKGRGHDGGREGVDDPLGIWGVR
ncbi:hypothetical protein FQN53_008483 [Emmonsiellopsis sp. PD_33]|nr:hypothetical protein FQN53_008483 [Emmonsiellopsis sp. PD_33]